MSAQFTALPPGLFRATTWTWPSLARYWHAISMQSYLAAQYWLESVGAGREKTSTPAVSFNLDRDFSSQGFRNAILNSNHSQSDYAIVLNMPLLQTATSSSRQLSKGGRQQVLRTYLDHLVSEIRILGSLVSKNRRLCRLYWPADMTRLLEPAEMTEVLYYLNRSFSVRQDQTTRFVFELPDIPEDDSIIALARGLGFTDIFLSDFTALTPHPQKDLKNFVQLLRRYGFSNISTCLDYRHLKKRNEVEKVARRAADLKLNAICLSPHPAYAAAATTTTTNAKQLDLPSALERLEPVLSKRGYERNGHVFTDQTSTSPPLLNHVFGLGLGAISIIDNMFGVNVDQLDQYYSLIDRQQLAFGSGGYIQPIKSQAMRYPEGQ